MASCISLYIHAIYSILRFHLCLLICIFNHILISNVEILYAPFFVTYFNFITHLRIYALSYLCTHFSSFTSTHRLAVALLVDVCVCVCACVRLNRVIFKTSSLEVTDILGSSLTSSEHGGRAKV